MAWVGHKDADTVAVYLKVRDKDALRRMRQMNFVGPENASDVPKPAA